METINWHDFEKVEIRAGTIVGVLPFPEAKKPAYKIQVDFGAFGLKWSSAQITKNYQPEELIGTQVIGTINLPVKQIGKFFSEFLLTGFVDEQGEIILARPASAVPNGNKLI